jgi:3-phenylpropionate/trans-cinnamate dioxygenase ferredoxin reductase component
LELQRDIVIVGGSAAGVQAARAVAEAGQGQRAMVITAEQRLPYKRTKVSKKFAAGFERDAFALQDQAWWKEHGFELRLGTRVTKLDPAAHTLTLDNGDVVRWERLVLATGATPNRLALDDGVAATDAQVHYAHNIAQVETLRAAAARDTVRSALVVGMGAMGVEVAEQLRHLGKEVTLAGDTPAPLADELNLPGQQRLTALLGQNGVRLRCGQVVRSVERTEESGLTVTFKGADQGQTFDLVAFCIGTRPRVGLARRAGLSVGRGVEVDGCLRTSHPDIFAAGDAAQHRNRSGRVTYLWRHAMEQGRVAGLNALGGGETYRYVPFRLKVKVFGGYFFALDRPAPADLDRYEVVETNQGQRHLCAYYLDGRLRGLIMVDDEPNQKRYNLAVGEGWDRPRFEREFGL